jgi:hypothetical protein
MRAGAHAFWIRLRSRSSTAVRTPTGRVGPILAARTRTAHIRTIRLRADETWTNMARNDALRPSEAGALAVHVLDICCRSSTGCDSSARSRLCGSNDIFQAD